MSKTPLAIVFITFYFTGDDTFDCILAAVNSGFDAQDSMVKLTEAAQKGTMVGLDLETGEPLIPTDRGIFDNYVVKKQMINSW